MSFIDSTSPRIDSANVTIIPLLPLPSFRALRIFLCHINTFCRNIFLRCLINIIINSLEMLYVTTESKVSCKYRARSSSHIDLVMVGRDVVTIRLYAGLWTQDAGLWTLDPGFSTLDVGCWILQFGRWALGTGHYR